MSVVDCIFLLLEKDGSVTIWTWDDKTGFDDKISGRHEEMDVT